jgi:hypothetical protein
MMETGHRADYGRGVAHGLERAREMILAAPVLLHGQRKAGVPGGVPRVMDSAVDPDGDPDYVHNSYALRDAVLYWIEQDLQQSDGPEKKPSVPISSQPNSIPVPLDLLIRCQEIIVSAVAEYGYPEWLVTKADIAALIAGSPDA